MALPVINFQPLSFDQANPLLTGIQAGQGLYKNAMQNKYLQPGLQQQLQNAIYTNQMLQPQAQNAQQITQADLALKQAQTPYTQAQTQGILQGQIPLQQAQAGLARAQTPYAGYQAMGSYYGGLGRYMAYSPSSQIMRYANNPLFQSLIANDPQKAQQLTAIYESNLNQGAGNPGMQPLGLPGQSMNSQSSEPANPQAQVPQPSSAQAPQSAQPQMPNAAAPQQQQSAPTIQTSNPDADAVQQTAQSLTMSRMYTPAQVQQITYDASAQNMIQQAAPELQSVAKFSGAAGAVRLKQEQLNASLGQPTSQDYQNYLDFTRSQMPLIANEIRRAFGGQATNEENKTMIDLVNPISWDKSTPNALNRFQALVNAMHANTKAITQPKFKNLQQMANSQPIQIPGATNYTPTGATNSSQQSSGTNLTIPKFNSKQEFQSWFSVLAPDQKTQVRAQLGNS